MRGLMPVISGIVAGAVIVTLTMRSDRPEAETGALPVQAAAGLIPSAETGTVGSEQNAELPNELSLPEDSINARIHAIVSTASTDVAGAIEAAAAFGELEQRRVALLRLVPTLVDADPKAALLHSAAVNPPYLENEFAEAIFDAWVQVDAEAVFELLESGSPVAVPPPGSAFTALAVADPERVLRISESLRRDVAQLAAAEALGVLTERDPALALANMDSVPPGAARSNLVSPAIVAYAAQDPEAAWDWVIEADGSPQQRFLVIRGLHSIDPDQAWEKFLTQWNGPDPYLRNNTGPNLLNYVNTVITSENKEDIIIGLDRLVSLDHPLVVQNLSVNLGYWSNENPVDAQDWILSNLDNINAESILPSLSSGLAKQDMDLARQILLELDASYRGPWSQGVARELAQSDLAAAESWAFEMSPGPTRDAALLEVLYGQVQGGSIDQSLFDLIEGDDIRNEVATQVAQRLGCDGQTELAHEVATAYVTDERTLRTTRQLIDDDPDYPTRGISCQMSRLR